MSDSVHNAEIEDVLSSIRRLVAGDVPVRAPVAAPEPRDGAAVARGGLPEPETEVVAGPVAPRAANPPELRPLPVAPHRAGFVADPSGRIAALVLTEADRVPDGPAAADAASAAGEPVDAAAAIDRLGALRAMWEADRPDVLPQMSPLARPGLAAGTEPGTASETLADSGLGSPEDDLPLAAEAVVPPWPAAPPASEQRVGVIAAVVDRTARTIAPAARPADAPPSGSRPPEAVSSDDLPPDPDIEARAPAPDGAHRRSGFAFGVRLPDDATPPPARPLRPLWAAPIPPRAYDPLPEDAAKEAAPGPTTRAPTEPWPEAAEPDAPLPDRRGEAVVVDRSEAAPARPGPTPAENLFAAEDDGHLDPDALRDLVVRIVQEELQGALGERITRNVRKLVRREIQRALSARDFD